MVPISTSILLVVPNAIHIPTATMRRRFDSIDGIVTAEVGAVDILLEWTGSRAIEGIAISMSVGTVVLEVEVGLLSAGPLCSDARRWRLEIERVVIFESV